ncbi:MAG: GNAT family N-acetyltransferase, partial [Myxococcales bacterium]
MRPLSSPPPPRAVSEDEWPALRTALNAVFRPAGGDLTRECPLLFEPKNRVNLRVICSTSDGTWFDGAPDRGGQSANPDLDPDTHRRGPSAGIKLLAHAGFVTRDALIHRHKARVACIGAVATAAPHRGHGLGSRVFGEALRAARRGADLVMVSGDRGLYRRQGLTPVPPLAHFRLCATTEAGKPLETRLANVADLKSLAALYDGDDVHFVRS